MPGRGGVWTIDEPTHLHKVSPRSQTWWVRRISGIGP